MLEVILGFIRFSELFIISFYVVLLRAVNMPLGQFFTKLFRYFFFRIFQALSSLLGERM